MTFFKRKMFLNIMLLVLPAAVMFISCPQDGEDDGGGGDDYPRDTLDVDYANKNNAVFFDFSTGTKTELSHDFFDIAILGSMSDAIIIANSGSYGSGVQVYKTNSETLTDDFSSSTDIIKEYTFKTETPLYDYQTAVNPLGALAMNGAKVCLVKVQYKTSDTPAYFKVKFGMTMGGQGGPTFNMTAVPGLGSGETGKVELPVSVSGITGDASFGWLYFKLVGDGGIRSLNNGTTLTNGAPNIPKAADWDILATRTDELQTENGTTVSTQMPVASRSSVLLNIFKGVKAKKIAGKLIDEVTDADMSDDGLSGDIDAIGYGWYTTAGMPPVYSVAGNTYIIKTAEGNFAKFQPETFAKDGKNFIMDFSYYYQN